MTTKQGETVIDVLLEALEGMMLTDEQKKAKANSTEGK